MSLETINATLLDLKPEDLLLDLGSGEGRHTISFGLSQKITAIGLDLSHADLKTATERLSDFEDLSCEQSPRVCFTQGSGNQLPFKDQQFNKADNFLFSKKALASQKCANLCYLSRRVGITDVFI